MLGQFVARAGPKSVITPSTSLGDRLVWTVKLVLDMVLPALVAGIRRFVAIIRHAWAA